MRSYPWKGNGGKDEENENLGFRGYRFSAAAGLGRDGADHYEDRDGGQCQEDLYEAAIGESRINGCG